MKNIGQSDATTKIGHETPFPGEFGADIWGIRVSIIKTRVASFSGPPGGPQTESLANFWKNQENWKNMRKIAFDEIY